MQEKKGLIMSRSQTKWCHIWDEIQGTSGTTPSFFRILYTNKLMATCNPSLIRGRTSAQGNTDNTANKYYETVTQKIAGAIRANAFHQNTLAKKEMPQIDLNKDQTARHRKLKTELYMKNLREREQEERTLEKNAKKRQGAMVNDHIKHTIIELCLYELRGGRSLFSEDYVADIFLQKGHSQNFKALHMLYRIINAPIDTDESNEIRSALYTCAKEKAQENPEQVPEIKDTKKMMFWIKKLEFDFTAALLQQFKYMAMTNAEAKTRALIGFSAIHDIVKSDKYLLSSKALTRQVTKFGKTVQENIKDID